MDKADPRRIAVLGAGPIGLEAALYARRLGLAVTIYERGRPGEYVQRWGHVRMFTPFGANATRLGRDALRADDPQFEFPGDSDFTTGREHVAAYLDPLAHCTALADCVQLETQVLQLGRRGLLVDDLPGDPARGKQPFRILVRDGKGRERIAEAEVVLDCTGTYGLHRWMGDGGIPAAGELAAESQIAYGLDDVLGERRGHYAGRNILVVGAGYSAATTVCNLARLAEENSATWVIWLARCTSTQPLKRNANDPLKERDRLAVRANTLATRPDGNVEFHNQSAVDAVEFFGPDRGFRVAARCAGKTRTWEIDRIVANVGYLPDTGICRVLQASCGSRSPCQPEPNYYILGSKSFGRDSSFLLRDGFEQVREVFALITGKSDLNLYEQGKRA